MQVERIRGATRVLGERQGYIGLPVRDQVIQTQIGDEVHEVQAMYTLWRPSVEELEQLNAGAAIRLCVLGQGHPPVHMEVRSDEDTPSLKLVANNSNSEGEQS